MITLNSDDAAVLGRSELLRGLSDGELGWVLRAAKPQSFRGSEFVIRQGGRATAQYLLTAGRLRVTQLAPDGKEVLLRFLSLGDAVGGVAALGDLVYTGSAQATEPSRVWAWSSAGFATLLDRCPRLAQNTMRLMAVRIREFQARCGELANERVDRRVAHALLRSADSSTCAALRLSRQDLAEMSGTTLFTVSRILSRWARERIITTGRQRVVIRDHAGLAAIADDLSA